jgi:HPt (histidine-containing phosphotransfer) domain-containing protein
LLRWLPASAGRWKAKAVVETLPRPSHSADLWARLEAVEGLDVAQGLELFNGDIDMYFRVLRLYARNYAGGMSQLSGALAAGSSEGLAAVGHSLRGASASIGATRIEQMARSLELLGEGDIASARHTASELQRLLIAMVRELQRNIDLEDEPDELVEV